MNNTYFLSIDSSNLGQYFSCALIKPHLYRQGAVGDFQSLFPDSLVFTKRKFSTSSDCCLGIILTDDEVSNFIVDDENNYFFLKNALPITRVASIFFHSKEKKQRTIALTTSSAFIPEQLISVITKDKSNTFNDKSIDFDKSSNTKDEQLTIKIDRYNRFLGGMAFLKFGSENFKNYSTNYFAILSYFNLKIKKEISRRGLDGTLKGVFDENNKQWGKTNDYIYGSTDEIISFLKSVKVPFKNNQFQYNSDRIREKKQQYIYSILANFGPEQSKSKKTDSLVKAVVSDSIHYKEAVTLFFGIHNGYKSFNKSYHFEKGTDYLMKFQLNSKLDYYTIESIYHYVFNKKISEDFIYLEHIIPINKKVVNRGKYQYYKVLDEYVIIGSRPTTIKEYIQNYFSKTKFQNVLTAFSTHFSKKNEIILTKEQQKKIETDFLKRIESPLIEHLDEIASDLTQLQEVNFDDIEHVFSSDEKIFSQANIEEKKTNDEKENLISSREIEIHKDYLHRLSNTELRKVAKKYKVSLNRKIEKANRDKIISTIIESIKNS